MVGRSISHYKIAEKLGEGGMGVVYRALDTHLDRPVAIKVLRAEAVADAERKKRFVQEAKAASALNHPNIITIHDIDTATLDGGPVDFMVMEFVAGKTLDRLIGHKGLRAGEALHYAVQMADALATAHGAGIIHRDIKPGNLMVNDKGLLKVLDFGLAKLTERAQADDRTATIDQAPHTEHGTIVGTVAYMSPEQAEGKKVDARSDIFSFGSVLYEVVTGQRAFSGETKLSTLSAILHKEPRPASEIAEQLPRELERIITRCLRKDPQWRFQHMDDLKVALAELKEESDSGRLAAAMPAPVPTKRPARRRLAAVAAGIVLLATVAAITWKLTRTPAPAAGLTLTRLTSDAGLTAYPALSKDGKLLTYASDRSGEGNLDIWVQQIGGGEPIRLTRHEADDSEPAFSPTGTRIAFRSERDGGGIHVVPALGGADQRIAEQGRSPRFSPPGNWIAYWTGDQGVFSRNKMYVMPSAGGPARQLRSDFYSAFYPLWSADGKRLLFLGVRDGNLPPAERFDWWVTALDDGAPVRTDVYAAFQKQKAFPRLRDPGEWFGNHFVLSAGTEDHAELWRVRLSSSWRMEGDPQRLTVGTGVDAQPSIAAGPEGAPNLVFTSSSGNLDIWSLPVDANQGKVTGEMKRLTSNAAADTSPSVSSDGKRVAFLSDRAQNRSLWLRDLDSGRETSLTSTPSEKGTPRISPDGSRVIFESFDDPKAQLQIVSSGGGVSKSVCEDCGVFQDWSPDGKKIILRKGPFGQQGRLALQRVGSGEESASLKHAKYTVTGARFSADNRWVSFQIVLSPLQRQIFVAAIPEGGISGENDWIAITDGSGFDRNAVWSRDGALLYFLSERDGFRCFWAQRLDPKTKRPAGPAFPAQHFHQARRSLMSFQEVGSIGLSAARDKLVFSMAEYSGNIWMGKLQGQ